MSAGPFPAGGQIRWEGSPRRRPATNRWAEPRSGTGFAPLRGFATTPPPAKAAAWIDGYSHLTIVFAALAVITRFVEVRTIS
jgi:hypothetical protein